MDKDIIEVVLEKVGLTKSEIKIYLALLELGSTSKGPLVKKAGITSSKVYEVLDKLIDKGLASYVLKNKVKYFKAAPPNRIKDYLDERKDEISEQQEAFEKILPYLKERSLFLREEIDAEIFKGWRGMETVFEDMVNTLNKGEIDYVFGASKGYDPVRTRNFYDKYQIKTYKKGIKIKAIFNENSREYFEKSKVVKKHIEVRYLKQNTPTEINIYGDKVLIIILSKIPIVIMIKGSEVASSFRQYFDVMWEIAKS
jgi:sugar-specific transcriptional regulator TrmB